MASTPVRIGDLEINQDLDAQRNTWVIQRIGHGLERMEPIIYAVMEVGGGISVIPK